MTGWWSRWRERYEGVVDEYGTAAIVTYIAIFGVTLLGFYTAVRLGYRVEGTVGTAGTLGAAYLATKMSQPVRIGATVVLTPAIVWVVRKVRGARAAASSPALPPWPRGR